MSWAEKELEGTELGDKRRERRLVKIVEDLASSPESSVPLASRDRAALQGMYEFWSNRRIRAEGILSGHIGSTVNRCDGRGVILAIQDTTELDYSRYRNKRGLGYLRGKGTQGALLHSTIAVSWDGKPLGLLHQRMWVREGRGTKEQRRAIGEKESGRWIEGMERSEELLAGSTEVVTVADREADLYELLSRERRRNSEYLIRLRHDRRVKETEEGEWRRLGEVLRGQKRGGYFVLELGRTPRAEARATRMWVTWVSVWLEVPSQHPRREEMKPVRVQVVWAVEAEQWVGEEGVEWILVTSLPVESIEEAQRMLAWYRFRWLIERYHATLKGGCRVEQLQLESFERLERAVACYAIVAWRLMWLTYVVRPLGDPGQDMGAGWVLDEEEWQALSERFGKVIEDAELSGLQQCVRWLAQLGGFLGRKSDGPPGARTIWRGLRRLRDLIRMPGEPCGAALMPTMAASG